MVLKIIFPGGGGGGGSCEDDAAVSSIDSSRFADWLLICSSNILRVSSFIFLNSSSCFLSDRASLDEFSDPLDLPLTFLLILAFARSISGGIWYLFAFASAATCASVCATLLLRCVLTVSTFRSF